jgi:predicted nucleotidyltransferase
VSLIAEHQDRTKALGVNELGLFGSFVREEQDAGSDVDVLVEFEQGKKTFDNFATSFLFRGIVQTVIYLEGRAEGLSKDEFMQDGAVSE